MAAKKKTAAPKRKLIDAGTNELGNQNESATHQPVKCTISSLSPSGSAKNTA